MRILKKILALILRSRKSWSGEESRRHVRHTTYNAEVIVGDKTYNVIDWGMGGMFFESINDDHISPGDKMPVVMKFFFPHETITVEQTAEVIRMAAHGVAAEFSPLNASIRRQFERVRDNLHMQDFLESQVA